MPSSGDSPTSKDARWSCGGIFDFEAKQQRLVEVTRLAEDPAVWSDNKRAQELGREIAKAKEAREIYKIGIQYNSVDETLAQLGMVPNREPGKRALPNRYAALLKQPNASILSRVMRGSCSR